MSIIENTEQLIADLQAENELLKKRIIQLETAFESVTEEQLNPLFLRQIVDLIPGLIFVKDRDGVFKLVNQRLADIYHKSVEEMMGKTDADFNANPEEVAAFRQADNEVMDSRQPKYIPEEMVNGRWYQTTKIPVIEYDGSVKLLLGVATDIHERKLLEQEREQLQQQVIEAQQQTLQELSTPVIPLLEDILVMPLVGSIDSERARDVMRSLLKSISEYTARIVILDITGVPMVDSGVANHLNKTILAAKLKGATTIITGISDAVAETIVDLGIDWSKIETHRDLEAGLYSALDQLNIKIVYSKGA